MVVDPHVNEHLFLDLTFVTEIHGRINALSDDLIRDQRESRDLSDVR